MIDNEITYEDIHKTLNWDVFDRTLPIFRQLFFDEKELKNLDYIRADMENSDANPKIVMSVAMKNNEPIAFIIGEYYRDSAVGFIQYIGKKQDTKYQTYPLHLKVEELFKEEAKKDGKNLLAAFSEVMRPDREDPKFRTIDPAKRIKIMERFGAKMIPITYYYPEWITEYKVIYEDASALMCYPVDKKVALDNPSVIKNFLTELYIVEGLKKNNKYLKKMLKEIDQINI